MADNAQLDLTLELDGEKREDGKFRAVGTVLNNSATTVESISVLALFVNPNGRIAGTLSTRLDRGIPAGKSMRWEIDHGLGSYHSNNPFTEHLDPEYDVTYWVGISPNARFIFY